MQFNQDKLQRVASAAKARTTNKRWQAAIDKAVAGLLGGWIVTELQHSVAITTDGGTYFANGSCQCKAFALGMPCKHRAAARLIEIYNETVDVAVSERDELIAEIGATWLAKFPGESLADNLMARFRCNSLAMLNTDFLRRVLDAIA